MKNNGGCFAALGNVLVLFFFFYIFYLWATHKNPLVRLSFWVFVVYVGYTYYQEFDYEYYKNTYMTNEDFLKSLK
jgi:hypothetical protein